jgi:hypothetical protein
LSAGILPVLEAIKGRSGRFPSALLGAIDRSMKAQMTRGVAVVASAGLAVALAACSQTTYGTGRAAGLQTVTDFARIAAVRGEQKDIEYQPRAPIVMPPSNAAATLPPPGGTVTTTASTAAVPDNWPKDPDIEAARTKAEIAQAEADGRPIVAQLPAGLRKAPNPNNNQGEDGVTADVTTADQSADARQRLSQAKSIGKVDADGNPVRVYLSDPPPDYLKPDPEAPQDLAAAEESKSKLKWPWQWFKRDGS